MSDKEKKTLIVPDKFVEHIWRCDDCGLVVRVSPWFYGDSGTPMCKECVFDMTYLRTELIPSPELIQALTKEGL